MQTVIQMEQTEKLTRKHEIYPGNFRLKAEFICINSHSYEYVTEIILRKQRYTNKEKLFSNKNRKRNTNRRKSYFDLKGNNLLSFFNRSLLRQKRRRLFATKRTKVNTMNTMTKYCLPVVILCCLQIAIAFKIMNVTMFKKRLYSEYKWWESLRTFLGQVS